MMVVMIGTLLPLFRNRVAGAGRVDPTPDPTLEKKLDSDPT